MAMEPSNTLTSHTIESFQDDLPETDHENDDEDFELSAAGSSGGVESESACNEMQISDSDWNWILKTVLNTSYQEKLRKRFPNLVVGSGGTLRSALNSEAKSRIESSDYNAEEKNKLYRRLVMRQSREKLGDLLSAGKTTPNVSPPNSSISEENRHKDHVHRRDLDINPPVSTFCAEPVFNPDSMFNSTEFSNSEWQQILDSFLISRGGKNTNKDPRVFDKMGCIRPPFCAQAKHMVDRSAYTTSEKETILSRIMRDYSRNKLFRLQTQVATSSKDCTTPSVGNRQTIPSKRARDSIESDRDSVSPNSTLAAKPTSAWKRTLENRISKDTLELTPLQSKILERAMGPTAERLGLYPFSQKGKLPWVSYNFLLLTQDFAGKYLIGDSLIKEVFSKDEKRPLNPVFRSIDDRNSTFRRIEIGTQGTGELATQALAPSNPKADEKVVPIQDDAEVERAPKKARSACKNLTASRQPETSTAIGEPKGQRESSFGHDVVDARRHYLPHDFEYLDVKAVTASLEKINDLAYETYSTKLQSQNPHGYKPFHESRALLLHGHLNGSSVQLPELGLLRKLLNTPTEMSLVERLDILSLGDTSFPDVMQMVLNYMAFEKLSSTIFFPDNHKCLETWKLLQDNQPDKDFSIIRKKAITKESESMKFKDLCSRLSTSWALEANAILSPLMEKFRHTEGYDEQAAFEERKALFCDMLHLHARFEVESGKIEYFWPSPGDPVDRKKHDGYRDSGLVHFTRRFGVKFTEDMSRGGKEILFLKASVQVVDAARLKQLEKMD